VNALISLLPGVVIDHPLPYAFLLLLLFGFITPLCEELAVIFVGVTMHSTGTAFLPAVAVGLTALLIQDSAYFHLARLFGSRLTRVRFLSIIFKPKAIDDGKLYFSRRGPRVVFISRFVVGLRSAVILGAGFLGMRWSRFVLYDLAAAVITTTAWMAVGFMIGSQFDEKAGQLTKLFAIIGPVAIVIGAVLIFRSVKADKAKIGT